MKILKISSLFILFATLFLSCQKEYSVENVATPAGTWQFNDSTKLFTGNIDTAYIATSGTTKTMNLMGKSTDGKQVFALHITATDSFTVGTSYKASLYQSDFQYYSLTKNIYQADQSVGEFIVIISALGNNNVTGTFSGAAQDSTGKTIPLTLGKFTSRIILGSGNGGSNNGVGAGTLGSTAGTCTGYNFSGLYTQGVALGPSHTVSVPVNVTALGSYSVTTNTVNGVTFSKTGTFTLIGQQSILLLGSGLPIASGVKDFIVTYGTSTCNFSLTFATGTPPAIGTLGGQPGTCTSVTPAGTYTPGVALSSANTLTIQVNVTSVGPYSLSTNTVNGVSFLGTGTFTTTGPQTVILTGSGTPTNSGSTDFVITFGANTCNYSLVFGTGTSTVSDYFPTTAGSFWALGNVNADPTDSFIVKATSGTKTVGSISYNIFTYDDIPSSGPPTELYYRKTPGTGLYYEYFNTEDFGFDAGSSNPKTIEYIFLDTTKNINTSYQSPSTTGTLSSFGPGTFTIYIKVTLLAKKVSASSGIVQSTDVMKTKYEYYISGGLLPTPTLFLIEERWFARNIGLIYNSFEDKIKSTPPSIYKVGRYMVF